MAEELNPLQYPVGKYFPETPITQQHLTQWIKTMGEFPAVLRATLKNYSAADLQKNYRPGGWMVLQVVHHLADSHLNSYTRFKLGITEENPVIKPYREDLWAELPDGKNPDISVSLNILDAVHARLTMVLKNMTEADWKRNVHHPEHKKDMTLAYLLGLYDWHCRHHLGHIKLVK
jgi:DinB superfamily